MIYLGTHGRMVGIACPAEQRLGTAERFSFQTTLEGRVKAQVRPVGRRVWDLRLPRTSTPSEVAALAAFANGDWGPGPFWFVSADAPVVNLLSHAATQGPFSGYVDGGPVQLDSGQWAPFSSRRPDFSAGGIAFSGSTTDPPVIPGVPVTGSAWVFGASGSVMLQFIDAAGVIVHTVQTPSAQRVPSGSVHPVRVHVTGVAPDNAVRVRLTARDALYALNPAVTWTDQPYEFGDGQGCPKAVVLGGQRNLVQALDASANGRYADYSFTVQEVG